MTIAISVNADSDDALPDPRFGRAAAFMLVDADTGSRQIIANPAVNASGGAGVQAAEFIIGQGAKAVISGSFGPKAAKVLAAAGIKMIEAQANSVDDLLRHYQAGGDR